MVVESAQLLAMLPLLVQRCSPRDQALRARVDRVLQAQEHEVGQRFGAAVLEQYRVALRRGQALFNASVAQASEAQMRALCSSLAAKLPQQLEQTERELGVEPAQTAPSRGQGAAREGGG
jgi:hypothetical protein